MTTVQTTQSDKAPNPIDLAAQAQAEAADKAAKAKALDQSEAVKTATKTIKDDIKRTAGVSRGVFHVLRSASDEGECKAAFVRAETNVMKEFSTEERTIKTMKDLCEVSGVKQFAYTSILSSMITASIGREKLVKELQGYYDWVYSQMSKEDQAKHGHDFVPEGFLDPWSKRYANTDDEEGFTRFNRDRRLAVNAESRLNEAKRTATKAREQAEAQLKRNLANEMAKSGATADTAPAGSGGTAQGMQSGTRQSGQLSAVVQASLNLVINQVHAAKGLIEDEVLLPILTRCHDDIVILISQKRDAERDAASAAGARPVIQAIVEQTEPEILEQGELQPSQEGHDENGDPADPADMGAADLDNLDAAIAEELAQHEAGQNAEPSDKATVQ